MSTIHWIRQKLNVSPILIGLIRLHGPYRYTELSNRHTKRQLQKNLIKKRLFEILLKYHLLFIIELSHQENMPKLNWLQCKYQICGAGEKFLLDFLLISVYSCLNFDVPGSDYRAPIWPLLSHRRRHISSKVH